MDGFVMFLSLAARGFSRLGCLPVLLCIFEGWAWMVGVALEDAMDRGGCWVPSFRAFRLSARLLFWVWG